MAKIYSYVVRTDSGSAPNPFWGVCTLTICKPNIRRVAEKGDWVIGTGSKNSRFQDDRVEDFSSHIVYAMEITDKMTLKEYDQFCNKNLPNKIPQWNSKDWRLRLGDCIYDYASNGEPLIRDSVHNEGNRARDLGGINSLLSNRFYYFGGEPKLLPEHFHKLIKRGPGHKKIQNKELVDVFVEWIKQFEQNRIYAEPLLARLFKSETPDEEIRKCSHCGVDTEDDDMEELVS